MTMNHSSKIHGSHCRWCDHFPECSKPQVKNVRGDSEICHWGEQRFTVKQEEVK